MKPKRISRSDSFNCICDLIELMRGSKLSFAQRHPKLNVTIWSLFSSAITSLITAIVFIGYEINIDCNKNNPNNTLDHLNSTTQAVLNATNGTYL